VVGVDVDEDSLPDRRLTPDVIGVVVVFHQREAINRVDPDSQPVICRDDGQDLALPNQQGNVLVEFVSADDHVILTFHPGMSLERLLIIPRHADIEARRKARALEKHQTGQSLHQAGGPRHISAGSSDSPTDAVRRGDIGWPQPAPMAPYQREELAKRKEPQTHPHQAKHNRSPHKQTALPE